MLTKVFLDQLL